MTGDIIYLTMIESDLPMKCHYPFLCRVRLSAIVLIIEINYSEFLWSFPSFSLSLFVGRFVSTSGRVLSPDNQSQGAPRHGNPSTKSLFLFPQAPARQYFMPKSSFDTLSDSIHSDNESNAKNFLESSSAFFIFFAPL